MRLAALIAGLLTPQSRLLETGLRLSYYAEDRAFRAPGSVSIVHVGARRDSEPTAELHNEPHTVCASLPDTKDRFVFESTAT